MSDMSRSPDAIERTEAHAYASVSRQLVVGAKLAGLDALTAGEVDAAPTTICDLGGEDAVLRLPGDRWGRGKRHNPVRGDERARCRRGVRGWKRPSLEPAARAAAGNRGVARADARDEGHG